MHNLSKERGKRINRYLIQYFPLDTYIPDGEPHVFGNRVYIYGSHDKEGGNL